jgi:16S rRNA (guanine966-N2)-methyltransferase
MLSRKAQTFDIIFVDPPYLRNFVNSTLQLLAESTIITSSSLIIVEHHPKEPITSIEGLTITDKRSYGQTHVSFLKLTAR